VLKIVLLMVKSNEVNNMVCSRPCVILWTVIHVCEVERENPRMGELVKPKTKEVSGLQDLEGPG